MPNHHTQRTSPYHLVESIKVSLQLPEREREEKGFRKKEKKERKGRKMVKCHTASGSPGVTI